MNVIHHSLIPLPPPGSDARRLAQFLLVLGPLLCGVLAVWLGQDANWDLRNYHWYNAYALLTDRHGYDLLPSQTPFFYNPLLDVLVFMLAKVLPGKAVGFVLGVVQGLNFCLIFMISHALLIIPKASRKVMICAALAALGMAGAGGIAQIGTTFNDNMVSLGLLTSILLVITSLPWLVHWKFSQALPKAFVYGMPAGIALGLKLTLVCFCIGITLAWLCTAGRWRTRLLLAFAFGCGMTAGMLFTQGFWMWHLWVHYDNPIFPYFNQYFASSYAPLTSARDLQFMPKDWQEAALFPWLFTLNPKRVGEIAWQDWRVLCLYVLLPLCSFIAVLVGRRHDKSLALAERISTRYLLWALVFSYGSWLGLFSIYRYLIPLEMLAPLAIVLAIGLVPLRPNVKWLAAGAVLVAIAGGVRGGDWGRVPWSGQFVQVLAPAVPNPEKTMLLMAGFEPYSHILPSFHPLMPVVRIQSNFASPNEGHKGINKIIAARLQLHDGPFMLLLPDWQVQWNGVPQEALSIYGLKFAPSGCQKFPDNLGYKYALCPVEPIKDKK